MKKYLVIFIAMLLAGTLIFVGCPQQTSGPQTLEIGVIDALTGFGSSAEMQHWQGVQVAEEWFNEQGGITIGGQQYLLKFLVEDCKGTADGAVNAANKLVNDDGVKFMIGDMIPFTRAAASTITEPAKVLRCDSMNQGTPAEFSVDTPYTFVGGAGTLEQATALIDYLGTDHPEVKTMVIIMPDDGAQNYIWPKMQQMLEAQGITLLSDPIIWPMNTVDFPPVVAKGLALKPDALALWGGGPGTVGLELKAAREAGFNGTVIVNSGCPEIAQVSGAEAANGVIACAVTMDYADNPPIIKDFAERLTQKWGQAFYYQLRGVGIAHMFVKVIEEAQSIDPTVVKDKWEQMASIETIYGTAPMGGLQTYGLNHMVCHPLAIQTVIDGKVTHIKWVTVVTP